MSLHFREMCANERQNSKPSLTTIYVFIIIFLIIGHKYEIIMILFVANALY